MSSGCRLEEVVEGIATARGAVKRPGDLILVLSLPNLEKLFISSPRALYVMMRQFRSAATF